MSKVRPKPSVTQGIFETVDTWWITTLKRISFPKLEALAVGGNQNIVSLFRIRSETIGDLNIGNA